MSCLFFVSFAQFVDEVIYCIILYDTYGAAAESAACDTGTDHAFGLPCQIYQYVDLFAGYFIVISQRYMGSIHQFTEFLYVTCIQCCYSLDSSLVFVYGMMCSLLANRIFDGIFIFFEFFFA